MSLSRASLTRSPGIVLWNSATFFTRDDLAARLTAEWKAVETSMYGQVDKVRTNLEIKLPLLLWGSWENVSKLFPSSILNPTIGAGLFGTTDLPLVIQGRNNDRLTFASAQITRLADLHLGVDRDLFAAAVEFTCLLKNATAPEADGAFYTVDTNTYSDTAFAKTNFTRARFTGTWGAVTGFTNLIPQDGFKVSWNLELKPVRVDGYGTVDYTLDHFSASVKCLPIGPSLTQLLGGTTGPSNNQLQGYAHGILASAVSNDLTLTSSVVTIVAKNAFLADSGAVFSREKLRNGEIEFQTTRGFSAGVPAAVATAV